MSRVTLVNAWHDDNKGDSAIVIATMNVLQEIQGEKARFGLVAQSLTESDDIAHAYRHVRSACGCVEVAPCLLPTMKAAGGTRWQLALSALSYLCRLLSASLRLKRSRSSGARLIAESALVISKGGHKLHTAKSNPLHYANLYSHLAPLLLARHYGVPFVLWGHSLGPFHDRFSRWWVRAVLKDATAIGVRESLSGELAIQLRLPADRVYRVPDPAFALTPALTPRVEQLMREHELEQERFLTITVRWIPHLPRESYSYYLDQVARIGSELLRAGFVQRVAVVVHTMGPIPREDDSIASRQLLERLRGLPVCLIQEDLSPMELSALYGQSKFLLGTRFHSVILALVAGAPCYALSYFGPKSLGIMQDMGMGDWVVPAANLKADAVVERILGADLNMMRAHLEQQVALARQTFHARTCQLMCQMGLI